MIHIEALRFRYPGSDFVLDVDEMTIEKGTKTAIVGPSGSGKTTLLNLVSGISTPESGAISIGETNISGLNDRQRRDFRIQHIGMVFQQFELVEYLKVRENILLPYSVNATLELTGDAKSRLERLAKDVGVGDKLKRFPHQLSQGEQQRVAICRALVTEPQLILADEPTGNLDPDNKDNILDILFQQSDSNGQTLIVVTHDHSMLPRFDRVVDFSKLRRRETAS